MRKLVFISLICVFVFSCKKDETNGGAGTIVQGDAIVYAQVMHHHYEIANIKVWIKKGATSFPGVDTTLYDSYQISDMHGFVRFDKLVNGSYYFYAKGFDAIFWSNVMGYVPFSIDNKPGETKEYDVTIPVSE